MLGVLILLGFMSFSRRFFLDGPLAVYPPGLSFGRLRVLVFL
jgi:hypothetical protein